jgi:hypothetical protein
MEDVYTPFGHREQSSVNAARNITDHFKLASPFRLGMVIGVYTSDNPLNVPGIAGTSQGYLVYDVEVTPEGVVLEKIPAAMSGGHVTGTSVDPVFSPATPSMAIQNTEETPFVIGQPVVVGFINNSPLNGFILCPIACQFNAGSQTAAQYPQKFESWQGTTRTIDKNGTVTYNIVSNQKFIVEVNGTTFLTVDGSTNTVDIGNGSEPGVLGATLTTYLNTTLNHWLSSHVHSGVSTGMGFSGAPLVSPPTASIETTVLKVQ